MWQTPKFWFQQKSILAFLLWPLSLLYIFAATIRVLFTRPYKSSMPVLCVGNVTLGGGGKTPTVLALMRLFQDHQIPVECLSRGYGGSFKGPLLVDLTHHTASETGDEPLLLAQQGPTWIAKDRKAGLRALEGLRLTKLPPDRGFCIMDDGYQNPSIYKDINVLVIDGPTGFGNGFVFPAGPLREQPQQSFNRAHAVIIIGVPCASLKPFLKGLKKPIFYATLQPRDAVKNLPAKKFIAFCGLANPAKFFTTLKENNLRLAKEITFPDHYLFSDQDIDQLVELSAQMKAPLITTEKDWVRLKKKYRKLVISFPIVLQWQDESKVTEFFVQKVHEIS